ncbi:hypothetical protein GCM10007939_22400 [Amylibacter marinus]|uniref:Glycosyltransferase subfamily 4-like N-terminal domain-containing protein n=1 Tax=Amylibacter marinus TaxID=1475483 RepID=A0ABQ5VX04_9RHOB|nr:glycosyltransferase [Amylibacter marinus]GLQ35956.1 hypothetical protein GCM10007939_22400 [Amylibacter marinus]
MKNYLLVAYAYPPISAPGAVRATRQIAHLEPLGWRATVVTVQDGYSLRKGGLADPLDNQGGRLLRIKDPVAQAHGRIIAPSSEAPSLRQRVLGRLKALANAVIFPDRSILWALGVRKMAKAIPNDFELVYSSSPTASSHLAGYFLARRLGVPWIAEFRDPLSWISEKNTMGAIRRSLLCKYEAWVVKRADAVVVVSEAFAEYFSGLYPDADIVSIANGAVFDETQLKAVLDARAARGQGEKLRLVHTGSFYNGERPIAPLIEAVKLAQEKHAVACEILCAGNDAHLATAAAKELGCLEMVKDLGVLSHAETVDLLQSADATLSLLHNEDLGKISIMSKFLDYLPAGAPILNLGAHDAMLSRIIREDSAGGSFEYGDTDAIAAWIADLPNMAQPDTVALCQKWSAENMAKNVADLMARVLG